MGWSATAEVVRAQLGQFEKHPVVLVPVRMLLGRDVVEFGNVDDDAVDLLINAALDECIRSNGAVGSRTKPTNEDELDLVPLPRGENANRVELGLSCHAEP